MSVTTPPRPRDVIFSAPPNPVLDQADTAEAELIIYDCGTTAPGLVHEPCQHSTLMVQCCTCAGCMFDLWSCRADDLEPQWWEAIPLGRTFEPWARHPYAMVLYALMTIFLLASQTIPALFQLIFTMVTVVATLSAFALKVALF